MVCYCESKNCECEIGGWIREVLKDKHAEDELQVKINGNAEKGTGYLGDIAFAQVSVYKNKHLQKQYDLVVKIGKTGDAISQRFPVRLSCQREAFVYQKIIPAFNALLAEKNLEPLDVTAKCFSILQKEELELLLLQNLATLGYEIHDKKLPMNLNHLKLTLQAYGKWHALSFAMRDQKREYFDGLCANLQCVWTEFIKASSGEHIDNSLNIISGVLMMKGETELLNRLKEKLPRKCSDIMLGILSAEEPQSVMLHGDCWNNNYMFQYESEDGEKKHPTKTVLIDFQIARIASPALDLAYHLYLVCSAEQLNHFDELLNIYFTSLSENLRALGTNPDKIFTYEDLLDHWEKYSVFGVILAGIAQMVNFMSKEESALMDLQDRNEAKVQFRAILDRHKDELASRFIPVVKHFLNFQRH
ncbi:uncharacterized protein LOC132696363 [Cylas formicarius]|uniref:uncharacterized protein LOC132696363 n=1 Tax=Cylas formicarius TaxID=197179 RepID=UPI0029583550|nr:uncharacterized protein LOC132696363 [Cylas formicarius]